MDYENDKRISCIEHDVLWRALFKEHVPQIADSLRRSNAIECIKELYSAGALTTDDYIASLKSILKSEGFSIDK